MRNLRLRRLNMDQALQFKARSLAEALSVHFAPAEKKQRGRPMYNTGLHAIWYRCSKSPANSPMTKARRGIRSLSVHFGPAEKKQRARPMYNLWASRAWILVFH